MNACDFQQALFQMLRERASRPHHLARELTGVIFKSRPTVYKKMQGNILLTMDELIAICSHYQIELDPLLKEAPSFNSVLLDSGHDSQNAAERLLSHVQKWSNAASTTLLMDMNSPFIQIFNNPELMAFMMYEQHLRNDHEAKFSLFESRCDHRITSLASRIANAFRSTHRVEIWRSGMFDSLLSQVALCSGHNKFRRPSDALELCDIIARCLRQMEQRYHSRLDRSSGKVKLCLVEFGAASNRICVNSSNHFYLYQGKWQRNWTLTYSDLVAKRAHREISQVIDHEKRRQMHNDLKNRFFRRIELKIQQTRRNIEEQLLVLTS